MEEFYDNGGPTSFIDRVSASLGIHASQMKVVAVYTGSIVVDYEIEPAEGSADAA
jgi:DNA segregation ATPase FtsK/SpoIIIE-like protein